MKFCPIPFNRYITKRLSNKRGNTLILESRQSLKVPKAMEDKKTDNRRKTVHLIKM